MSHSLSNRLRQLSDSMEFIGQMNHQKRMIVLSEKVYGRRLDLDLSQEELANKAGTTQRIISQIENANYAPNKGIGEDYYDKLAIALEIDRDYLFSEKINRQTFELFAYLSEILGEIDIMQFMKIPYFLDLESVRRFSNQITSFNYYRWDYGPFDKKVYSYKGLVEENHKIKYTFLEPHIPFIKEILKTLPMKNGNKLKKLSYETAPMRALGATLGGSENMGIDLDMTLV